MHPAPGEDPLGERDRLLAIASDQPQRLPQELVRSPWFQSADRVAVAELLPLLAERCSGTPDGLLFELVLALRDAARENTGGGSAHRNLPQILAEREAWIGRLLREVARLRIWRLPGRRLSPLEAAFLERLRQSGTE